METEYLETEGSVPGCIRERMKWAQEQEEFENYLKLLSEAKACFGWQVECLVISYITKHKGDSYYLNLCSNHHHNEKELTKHDA